VTHQPPLGPGVLSTMPDFDAGRPRGVVARRAAAFDSSGIRKAFDLAARLDDPINLAIGQPDFAMPEAAQTAAKAAIDAGKNGYTPTQGIGPLRERLEPGPGPRQVRRAAACSSPAARAAASCSR
jgi:hypothetical protein